MRLRVLEHLVGHQEASHHEEDLDYDACVEQERFEEVVVGLGKRRSQSQMLIRRKNIKFSNECFFYKLL